MGSQYWKKIHVYFSNCYFICVFWHINDTVYCMFSDRAIDRLTECYISPCLRLLPPRLRLHQPRLSGSRRRLSTELQVQCEIRSTSIVFRQRSHYGRSQLRNTLFLWVGAWTIAIRANITLTKMIIKAVLNLFICIKNLEVQPCVWVHSCNQ